MRSRITACSILGLVLLVGATPVPAAPLTLAYEIADAVSGITENFDSMGGVGAYYGYAPGNHYTDWGTWPATEVHESYWSVKNGATDEWGTLQTEVNTQNTGGFNFGGADTVNNTDRALGFLVGPLGSPVKVRVMKARFKNTTGDAQTVLHVEFDAEPWADYGAVDGAGIKVWLDMDPTVAGATFGVDFFELNALEVEWTQAEIDSDWSPDGNGNLDGNALAKHIEANILLQTLSPGLQIANDQVYELQWAYTGLGEDAGLGVDNLGMTFTPEPGTLALLALGLTAAVMRRR